MKVSFYTLGCRLNQAETAIIAKSLQSQGFEITEFGQPADLTVINTCTVTEQADAKCRQAVRKTLRRSPETFVAVPVTRKSTMPLRPPPREVPSRFITPIETIVAKYKSDLVLHIVLADLRGRTN